MRKIIDVILALAAGALVLVVVLTTVGRVPETGCRRVGWMAVAGDCR